jgi:hypothetical protein
MKVSDEHWALAVEVFGGGSEAKYMLVGAGLRRDCTLKLLDALAEARAKVRDVPSVLR